MTLDHKEQLDQFKRQGYVKGGCILTNSDLSNLRREVDRVVAKLPVGQRPENMPSVHYDNQYIRQLLLSKPLVDVAEQILGPDIALFTSYIICKRPLDGLGVDWHQDAAFFPIEPMESFTLWLAIDDSNKDNGCMRVIPGSHRSKVLLNHKVDLNSGTTLPLSLDSIDLSKAVDVDLKAGEFSAHDVFILHGSNPNRSLRRRCGLTIKYIPTYVRIDRTYASPTKFDWTGIRLYLARGNPGNVNQFVNM